MNDADRLRFLDPDERHPYDLYCSDVQRRLIVNYHPGDGLSGEDLRRELCPDIPRLSGNDEATRDANFAVAKWLAWLSANVYIDDFGDIPYPGALFAIFGDMGFGCDGEAQYWIDKGLELRKAIRDGDRVRKDALNTELFTQLPPDRGLGKLHATRIGSKYFNQGSTQVYFLHDCRRALAMVAFRGTQKDSRADFRVDLDWKLVPYEDRECLGRSTEDAGVYQGFLKALLANSDDGRGDGSEIRDKLWKRLLGLPSGTRLYVTGHSLGGSLASLFTYATLGKAKAERPYSIVGLFTFGSPGVGNEPFARALNERMRKEGTYHARFVLGRDPVPRLHENVWFHEINKWLKPIGIHRLDDFTKYRHSTELDCKQEVSQVIHLPCGGTKYTTYFREDQEVCCFNLPWYRYLSRKLHNHSMRRYFDAIHECVKAGVSTQLYSS